jgi:hypothetical protein
LIEWLNRERRELERGRRGLDNYGLKDTEGRGEKAAKRAARELFVNCRQGKRAVLQAEEGNKKTELR